MFGFVVAGASFVGLIFLAVHRCRHGFGHRRLMRYLDASPGQERVIREAMSDVWGSARALKDAFEPGKKQLADLMEHQTLDKRDVEQWLEVQEANLAPLRERLADAAARIHEVLDTEQRKKLAKMVERGPRFYGRGHHHHHHAC